MSDLSYAALPNDQQRQLAKQMRGAHSWSALAAMFEKSESTIRRWVDPNYAAMARRSSASFKKKNRDHIARYNRNYWRQFKTRVRREPCLCGESMVDATMDDFCKRSATCIICGKAAS